MKPTLHFHPYTLLITPLISHSEVRCESEDCGMVHGYVVEIGWLYWSFITEFHHGTPV
jgi:hypothetical protein